MKTIQKNKFLRFALILASFACALLFFTTFSLGSKTARAAAPQAVATAHVGDAIVAADYDISYNGSTIKAEGLTVVYPSGGVYGGDSFVMEQAGNYAVTYYATANGKRVEETKNYLAIRMPQDFVIAEAGMLVEYGKYYVESPYELKKDTYGALVTFKAGQSITFDTTIKTSDLKEGYNIIDMIVMPSVYRETDFEKLTVRVTDCSDENNYVDIVIISSNTVDGDGQISYVQAGASGQQIGGYETPEHYHSNSINYGAQVEHSFRAFGCVNGNRSVHTVSENSMTISIDNGSKKVLCGPTPSLTAYSMVNDLDDPAHYKGNPWGGFLGEEVSVKVTAERFSKAEGKVLIKSFGGYDFSQEIEDTQAPELKVACDESKGLPLAEVGKEFPIFASSAKDMLDKELDVNVYVYYLDNNGVKINVAHDGENFLAKYAGKYQIVYRAKDYSGNVSEKTLEILAQEELPEISVGIETPLIEKSAYETVKVPLASEMEVNGGSGYLSVERVVYDPNDNVLEIEDELQLTLMGEYRIVYTVTDYLGNEKSEAIIVRSNAIDKPYFVEEPEFTAAFVKGFKYDLPTVYVVETAEGKLQAVDCKISVNGELNTTGSFKASGESVVITYTAEGVSGTTVWEKTFSVVDTERGKYKSYYFHTESNMEIKDEKSYVEFLFDEACSTQFINGLPRDSFTVNMSYDETKALFSNMTITLVDAYNVHRAVTIKFFYNKEANTWAIQMNHSEDMIEYASSRNILTFSLLNGNKVMDESGVGIATMLFYDNGKAFEGFSDTLYLHMSFDGVEGASSMYITQIANQSMGYSKSSIDKALDEIKPIIILDEPVLMRQKLGSVAQIPTAKAYDVLGQVQEFTIKLELMTEDGAVLLASGQATEKLSHTFDKAGNYRITYFAKDTNGKSMTIPYALIVADETAPTLTVKDSIKSSYSLGAKINVPSYKAEDNDGYYTVQVMVRLPNDELRLLQYNENGEITFTLRDAKESLLYENAFIVDEDTFAAVYEGKYVLRVLAYDEYYNCTVEEFEFIVK